MLWQAGPAWPKHAPVLFPIVASLANDTLRHDGAAYAMSATVSHAIERSRGCRAMRLRRISRVRIA
jgi:hypothetical protein